MLLSPTTLGQTRAPASTHVCSYLAPRPKPPSPQQHHRRPTVLHAVLTDDLPAPTLQQGRLVQWYPGHIARTERQLQEQLTMVDVVLEVRDARIPMSSTHPSLAAWCRGKTRLLVMNRSDQVSESDRRIWHTHLRQQYDHVCWTNGVSGEGIQQLKRMMEQTGTRLNAQRAQRDLKPRAVRSCVIGFPNVGKSALINRLQGRRVAASAPKPGVTTQLRWIRMGGNLDLLDAPGVIPAQFKDQVAAQRLAMCNDIGEAAYTDSLIAAALYEHLARLPKTGMKAQARIQQRYGKRLGLTCTGEDLVRHVARALFNGQIETGAQRMLKDFRTGVIGRYALEHPA